ncbi:MAG: hypothetical protein GX621_01305 [Pirellulaceae bacterium]|nr:hypothetical protein [Pirellulaceae bacterium]
MSCRILRIVIASLALLLVLLAPEHSAAGWKAGAARHVITPESPLWLSGYAARKRPSEGTRHELWVKALALEDAEGNRGVIVTTDLLGFSPSLYEELAADFERECGLRREQVMLTASHTHTGPALADALPDFQPRDPKQREAIDVYTKRLRGLIVKTVSESLANMQPATVWAGDGTADFAVNRRENVEKDVVQIRREGKLRGPVDHDVPVLAVKKPTGELVAIVFGYACHATTLNDYLWSGDYPGFAQLALEKAHPELRQAMFFQGCGADQNPLPRRSVELCQEYGERLADAVEQVLARPMRPLDPSLAMQFASINLPFDPPSHEEFAKLAAEGRNKRWARRILELLDSGETLPTEAMLPVQVWRLGDEQLWIALGGEVVVDYALRFKEQYGSRTWVAGFTNAVPAYIPSDRVWREGGYESGAFFSYGLPTERWSPGIEQRIAEAVEELVAKTGSE